jgi:hypothetical protein
MARPKRDQAVKQNKATAEEVYVNFHDDDEDGFVTARESTVVAVTPAKRAAGKGKRSVEDMLASMPNKAAKAAYAMERIAALEDQIHRILTLCSPEVRALVLEQRKSLIRYAPEE